MRSPVAKDPMTESDPRAVLNSRDRNLQGRRTVLLHAAELVTSPDLKTPDWLQDAACLERSRLNDDRLFLYTQKPAPWPQPRHQSREAP